MINNSWYLNARIFNAAKKPASISKMMFIATFLLLFLSGGQVSAALHSGCTAYAFSPDHILLDFSSSSFFSGTRPFYSDTSCTTETGESISAGRGWVYADTEEEAESVCQSKVGSGSEATKLWDLYPEYQTANQKLWKCSGSAGGSSSNGSKRNAAKRKKVYIPPTGVSLNETDLSVTAVDGLGSGIEFQRVDQGGVGIDSVLDLGFLDAVDVWSNIGGGYEVCFPQMGKIIFLDAATSPRTVMEIQYEYRDGYTCASLDRAGTLVLVRQVDTADSNPTFEQPLANCTVTTTHRLNLRDAADGAVVQFVIPANVTVGAFARTESWFNVVYNETAGWVSARFVTTEGDCQYISVI